MQKQKRTKKLSLFLKKKCQNSFNIINCSFSEFIQEQFKKLKTVIAIAELQMSFWLFNLLQNCNNKIMYSKHPIKEIPVVNQMQAVNFFRVTWLLKTFQWILKIAENVQKISK